MADFYCKSGAGAVPRDNSIEKVLGDKIVILRTDTSANYAVVRKWVLECTTAGTTGAAVPAWPASVTQDVTTTTDGTVVWTYRKPGFSSGSTANWTFSAIYFDYVATALAAGDTLYVSNNHNEITTANNINANFAGTLSNPNKILCVNDSSSPPSALDNAGMITLGASYNYSINGYLYLYGIKLRTASGFTNSYFNLGSSGKYNQIYENVYFDYIATGVSAKLNIGHASNFSGSIFELRNCTFNFSSSNNFLSISRSVNLSVTNLVLTGTNFPTALLKGGGSTQPSSQNAQIRNSDLSALGSNALVDVSTLDNNVQFLQCKLASGAVIVTGTPLGDNDVEVINCDSADTNYRYEKHRNGASVKSDTSVYLTTGGAETTHNGVSVPISEKITTADTVVRHNPIYTPWQPVFNDTTGSRTLSIKVAYDGGAGNVTLKDFELFLEVESFSTAGFPIASNSSTRPDILNAGTSLTDTSEAWTGTGGWTNKKTHTLSKTVTVAEQGVMMWRIGACYNASVTTIYVDNKANLS